MHKKSDWCVLSADTSNKNSFKTLHMLNEDGVNINYRKLKKSERETSIIDDDRYSNFSKAQDKWEETAEMEKKINCDAEMIIIIGDIVEYAELIKNQQIIDAKAKENFACCELGLGCKCSANIETLSSSDS